VCAVTVWFLTSTFLIIYFPPFHLLTSMTPRLLLLLLLLLVVPPILLLPLLRPNPTRSPKPTKNAHVILPFNAAYHLFLNAISYEGKRRERERERERERQRNRERKREREREKNTNKESPTPRNVKAQVETVERTEKRMSEKRQETRERGGE